MDTKQIRRQAQDENTAPEILSQLSTSEDYLTRQYVASNLNTPVEILENLGEKFPDEIIANPIFNLLLLENPESKLVLLSLARGSTTSEEKLNELANHHDINIREAVVKNSKTPANILDSIFENNRYRLPLEIFLENKNTGNTTLEKIAINSYSYNKDVYNLILKHSNAAQTTIKIVKLYNGCLDISDGVLDKLANHKSFRVRDRVAKYPHTSTEILNKLSLDGGQNVRASVAAHPKTSKDILSNLAKDTFHRVRAAIAVREDISEEIAMILAHDISDYVREQLASNPNISTKVTKLLNKIPPSSVFISRTVDIKLSQEELEKFSTAIPEEIANKIVENRSNYVRRLLAVNPNISINILKKLREDSESCVRL